jgi:hypothetical protein
MKCARCGGSMRESDERCPRCGHAIEKSGGTFQTSTVMISAGGAEKVYRSVEEVPAPLRTRLLKSTNGANSATILIADRGGRKEIARAMRHLPANAQRRLLQSLLADGEGGPSWLGPGRRKALIAAITLAALAAIGLMFTRFG